ncbi:hypothetical protein Ddc_23238 [Ditylenchus destructor]|nr:hypothetical protein Ddc_23238 [Ditylenchus destructor]
MNANTTDIRRKKFEEKQKRMEEFADDLLNHFDQNSEYYRIQDGQIMSDRGTPMKKTSIEKIARSIAGLETERPEGQSLITKKMANMPEGKELLKRQYGSGNGKTSSQRGRSSALREAMDIPDAAGRPRKECP